MKAWWWKTRKRLGLTWSEIRLPFWGFQNAQLLFSQFVDRCLRVTGWWQCMLLCLPALITCCLLGILLLLASVFDVLTAPLQYWLRVKLEKEAKRNKAMLEKLRPPEVIKLDPAYGAGKTYNMLLLGGAMVGLGAVLAGSAHQRRLRDAWFKKYPNSYRRTRPKRARFTIAKHRFLQKTGS